MTFINLLLKAKTLDVYMYGLICGIIGVVLHHGCYVVTLWGGRTFITESKLIYYGVYIFVFIDSIHFWHKICFIGSIENYVYNLLLYYTVSLDRKFSKALTDLLVFKLVESAYSYDSESNVIYLPDTYLSLYQ